MEGRKLTLKSEREETYVISVNCIEKYIRTILKFKRLHMYTKNLKLLMVYTLYTQRMQRIQ